MTRTWLAAIPIWLSLLSAASAADLTVNISGAHNASGSIATGILNSEGSFPKPPVAFAAFRVKAAAGPVSFTVHDLPPGRYAVTSFHDENDNGKLDADQIGLPTEGYGVSNKAREILSPPQWSKASFELGDQNKTITVTIEY